MSCIWSSPDMSHELSACSRREPCSGRARALHGGPRAPSAKPCYCGPSGRCTLASGRHAYVASVAGRVQQCTTYSGVSPEHGDHVRITFKSLQGKPLGRKLSYAGVVVRAPQAHGHACACCIHKPAAGDHMHACGHSMHLCGFCMCIEDCSCVSLT